MTIYLIDGKPHRMCECDNRVATCQRIGQRPLQTAGYGQCLIPAPDVLQVAQSESVLTSTDHYRNGWNEALDRAAGLAECETPNDGREHDSCPFCSASREIKALKVKP